MTNRANRRSIRSAGVRLGLARLGLALAAAASLAGCESGARQDPLLVRPSSDAIVVSGMPMFRDRPLDDNLRGSLELTDYRVALDHAGLLDRLREDGPFTVFAAPNRAMEAEQSAANGQLFEPEQRGSLRHLLAYSIVPGVYTPDRLRRMIAQAHGPVALTTLDPGATITIAQDPASGGLELRDAHGLTSSLSWITARQSNGVLYVSPTLPAPADSRFASAAGLPAGSEAGTGAGGTGLDNSRFYVPGDYNSGVGATWPGATQPAGTR